MIGDLDRADSDEPDEPADWRAPGTAIGGYGDILSVDPLVILTSKSSGLPLGCASFLGPMIRSRSASFLLMQSWSMEPVPHHRQMIAAAQGYCAAHPTHRLIFLGNTDRETEIFSAAGFAAATVNHNCLVNEHVFRPLPGSIVEFDAVYNARLSARKRPELAREIEKLALIYQYAPHEHTVAEFHAEHARLRTLMPVASFINGLTPDGCAYLTAAAVNAVLVRARVGLCLSRIEGAMRASMEYLLAGLPVVSTVNLGGRDRYFHQDYSITVEADPRQIREAVEALIARGLPPASVRKRALALVERDRSRFAVLVQDIIDRAGGRSDFAPMFRRELAADRYRSWTSLPVLKRRVARAVWPLQPWRWL